MLTRLLPTSRLAAHSASVQISNVLSSVATIPIFGVDFDRSLRIATGPRRPFADPLPAYSIDDLSNRVPVPPRRRHGRSGPGSCPLRLTAERSAPSNFTSHGFRPALYQRWVASTCVSSLQPNRRRAAQPAMGGRCGCPPPRSGSPAGSRQLRFRWKTCTMPWPGSSISNN